MSVTSVTYGLVTNTYTQIQTHTYICIKYSLVEYTTAEVNRIELCTVQCDDVKGREGTYT